MYDVIYADPPWRYEWAPRFEEAIEVHYPTMAVEDICAMDISINKNAVLFLWATSPKLSDALTVMSAWGFTYKTCSVWDKGSSGLGYWFLQQHEVLLVGAVGGGMVPRIKHSSVWKCKRGRHSAKPLHVRDWIASNYPASEGYRKLEMFAREDGLFLEEVREEWDLFGNEVGA